jgi:hypothetical protein
MLTLFLLPLEENNSHAQPKGPWLVAQGSHKLIRGIGVVWVYNICFRVRILIYTLSVIFFYLAKYIHVEINLVWYWV